jgi:hypothetical protein
MDALSSCWKSGSNLRIRILEPAITELREKEALVIEWEAGHGEKGYRLELFRFRPDPQRRLDL